MIQYSSSQGVSIVLDRIPVSFVWISNLTSSRKSRYSFPRHRPRKDSVGHRWTGLHVANSLQSTTHSSTANTAPFSLCTAKSAPNQHVQNNNTWNQLLTGGSLLPKNCLGLERTNFGWGENLRSMIDAGGVYLFKPKGKRKYFYNLRASVMPYL